VNKVLISLPLVMSAWQNNSAVDVKISTVAFLLLLSRVARTNFGQVFTLRKKESHVMWQLLGNK
jgi:hypothetical protein